MKRKSITGAILASVSTIALLGSNYSNADCVPVSVKGKIFNTSHTPPLGSVPMFSESGELMMAGGASTLGVVALNGGGDIGKMKCALIGVYAGPGEGLDLGDPVGVLPNFTHTISCDDAVQSPYGNVHSQLTFNTTGTFKEFVNQYTISFEEFSEPKELTGTGAFAGTTGGYLDIDGTINAATGSIDMSFTGEICKG